MWEKIFILFDYFLGSFNYWHYQFLLLKSICIILQLIIR
jgi:hypothetical protein